jgi:hypothetical protein
MKITKEEADIGIAILIFTPSGRLWYEPRNQFIDGGGGVELPFA